MTHIEDLSKRAEVVGSPPTGGAATVVSVAQASATATVLASIRDSAIGLANILDHHVIFAGGRPADGRTNDGGPFSIT